MKIDEQLDTILQRYDDVFNGLGKLKDTKLTQNIDKSVTPVALKQRRIPFHIRKKVDDALNKLLEDDIIERVPENEPTPWVSPIVAIPQKDNSIRLCTDMRKPNEAIKRTRFPIPTIKDLDILLNGASYFSKLDVRQAFHQLELHEDYRYITTFATHRGLFRNKRLNFRTNAASEIFQNALEKSLRGITGVFNIHDDIFIFRKSSEEYDTALTGCLKKLSEIGITLRRFKCEILKSEIKFFGHTYSTEGIKPDAERIKDIKNPGNIQEVRSFLGMLNYCAKFIEDFSTLTNPLRDIIKRSKFELHQKTFETLKEKLISAPVMAYFDINKEAHLYVDASPYGLSAILMQKNETGDLRIVAYGSRSLTDVERRYSQTEREALAIVWGVEHFHRYVYGCAFIIITDHKPLEVIYGNVNSKPSARIERWVLRLQPYCFKVIYRQGKNNPADYMPRHPSSTLGRQHLYTEHYINFIAKNSVPKAMTRDEIATETANDNILKLLKQAIISDNWQDKRLNYFRKLKGEFSVTPEGIIIRGTRIFIPQKLRKRAIALAHESHQGVDKTKALIREKIWYPHIDVRIKEMVDNCIPCLATSSDVKLETTKINGDA